MADDAELYELAVRFPEAVLAMMGVRPRDRYRGEALEIKAASGRFDAVLCPEPSTATTEAGQVGADVVLEAASPGEPRYYVEFQGRHDREVELRWLLKIVMHRVQSKKAGPVRAVIFYTERRFLEAAQGTTDLGDGDEALVRFTPTRFVLTEVEPETLEAAGWIGRIALPLVGDAGSVRRDARRWLRELMDNDQRTPGERADAKDLFVRFLSARLPDESVYALLNDEENAVENTTTGRLLLAKGEAKGEAIGLRAAILDVLDARGMAVSAAMRERLMHETDPARLVAIHRAALRVGPDLAGLFPD